MNLLNIFIASAGLFFLSNKPLPGNCDNVPELNKEIVKYVKSKVNKKVARGECWDLAAEALKTTGAKWDNGFNFGKPVDPKKDCIYPGDIVQFEGVALQYRQGNTIYSEQLEHHTAIIFEVKEKGSYRLAQQNTSTHGKKVSIDPFELSSVTKGSYTFFRPGK